MVKEDYMQIKLITMLSWSFEHDGKKHSKHCKVNFKA